MGTQMVATVPLAASSHLQRTKSMANKGKNKANNKANKGDGNGGQNITAIIETPCGSRNKYDWDETLHGYRLKKVLPSGMSFPYNFGYIPGTRADDGDPLDVLVLMDTPAFPGCIVDCQLIGALEAEQREQNNGKPIRNDRLIAADVHDSSFSDVHSIDELPPALLQEIQDFFVNYNRVEGREFKVLGYCGSKQASKLIKKAKKS